MIWKKDDAPSHSPKTRFPLVGPVKETGMSSALSREVDFVLGRDKSPVYCLLASTRA